uniref:Uncharacterized protein n=1 Tax=Arundo donax TaxID=35708 RepID=A0A0A9HKL6_ARUDO
MHMILSSMLFFVLALAFFSSYLTSLTNVSNCFLCNILSQTSPW